MTESSPTINKSKKKTFKKKDKLLFKMSQSKRTDSSLTAAEAVDASIKINPFFDDFVDCIENLPSRLQLLLTELRNVDVLVKARHRKLHAIKQEIITRTEDSQNEETKNVELDQLLSKLHQLLVQCQTLGDQKVRLTGQIIEAIGTKTRQLGFDARSNEAKFNLEIDEEKILTEFKLACKKNRPIHHHYNVPGSSGSGSASRSSSRQIQQKQLGVDINKKTLNKKSIGIQREKDLYSFDDSSNLSNSPYYTGVQQQINGIKNEHTLSLNKKKPFGQRVIQTFQSNGCKTSLELKQRSTNKKNENDTVSEPKNHSDSSNQLATTRSKRQLNFSTNAPSTNEPLKKTLNQSLKLNKKRRLSLAKNTQSSSSSSSSNQCKSPSSMSSTSSTSSYKNKYLTNNTNNTNQSNSNPTLKQNSQSTLGRAQKENIKFNLKTNRNSKGVKRLNSKNKKIKKTDGEANDDEEEDADMESDYESDDEISPESEHESETEKDDKKKETNTIKKETKVNENVKEDTSDRNSNETESINNLDDEENETENDVAKPEEDKIGPKTKRIKQEPESNEDEIIEKTKKKFTRNSRNNLTETSTTTNTTTVNTKVIKSTHDEPLYCSCREISYGQMIMCDNDACNIEWFHFNCVKLTSKPKGKWYCPQCRGDNHKVMKKNHLVNQPSTSSNLSSPNYYNNYQYSNRPK